MVLEPCLTGSTWTLLIMMETGVAMNCKELKGNVEGKTCSGLSVAAGLCKIPVQTTEK